MNTYNELQIGFSDEFIYGNLPIKYIVTENKKLKLDVGDSALALGITQNKNGQEYIRWERVYEDLVAIESFPNYGEFKNIEKEVKKDIRNKLKETTITETELYL